MPPVRHSRQLDARANELLHDYLVGLGLHISLTSEASSLRSADGRRREVVLTEVITCEDADAHSYAKLVIADGAAVEAILVAGPPTRPTSSRP